MSQYDPTLYLKINVGHCYLYFMVLWFCLISWRLYDVWTSCFGIMSEYDPTFDLKINVGHWDLYFIVQWFCLVSWKTVWCMNIILQDYESVWHYIWPQNKCRSLWPIFHGRVILPYILKTIWFMNIILRDYESVCTFDLQINVGLCDLHFIVHWFCLISWWLFDIWTPYWGIMSQYDLTFDLNINVGHCDLCFMVQWFCLISWKVFRDWTSYFGITSHKSVWPNVWPQNICRPLWLAFHGPLNLP